MRLVFLGTSAGVPSRQRNVTALAVQFAGRSSWCLVDCGEGTQRQILASPVSLGRIDHIFITHLHGDHTLGLPGLLSTRQLMNIKSPLTLCGPTGLKAYLAATYGSLGGHHALAALAQLEVIEWELGEVGTYAWEGYRVTAIPLKHSVPSWAYLWQEDAGALPRKLRVKQAEAAGIPVQPYYRQLKAGEDIALADGRRFRAADFLEVAPRPYKVIIGGDNAAPELLGPYLEGVQLLVHEATYTRADFEQLKDPPLHTTAQALATVAAQHGVPNLIMTHISPRYAEAGRLQELYDDARDVYGGQLAIAEDFSEFSVSREGVLQRQVAD